MSITFRGVSHAFNETPVLFGVDLDVAPGEIVTLLGPSGSGKSTLLRLAAGLEALQAGTIELGEQRVTPENCPPPELRPAGLVFQQHALFPHLTVTGNIEFGLGHLDDGTRVERSGSILARAGLGEFGARYPHQLSGGQQQRVALARALAPAPGIMLLDEPFASVDILLRRQLREETRLLLKEAGATTLLVTHDPQDALMLADRIAIIVDGRIVQTGTPEELWQTPAHPFVAEVLSNRELVHGVVDHGALTTPFGRIDIASGNDGEERLIAIDPTAITITPDDAGPAEVADVRFAGDHFITIITAATATLHTRTASRPTVTTGTRVAIHFAPEGVIVYDANASH